MRRIITQVDQSTGGRAQIRSFDFNLSTLTAHLYGIVIRGTEKPDAPPLLQIDKLTVGLKIKSVFRRQISLSELLIEHPVVHVQVDRGGNSNIPHPKHGTPYRWGAHNMVSGGHFRALSLPLSVPCDQ